MVALVTQAEALQQLRLAVPTPTADVVTDVMFKAEQASAIVVDYLKRPFDDGPTAQPLIYYPPGTPQPVVPWTEATTPTLVKAAILTILTALYDGRSPMDELLSEPVTSILHRYRDPALA
jgi:hypothetical protein